jgi:hypothetical protein
LHTAPIATRAAVSRALQHVTDVVEAVLHDAGQVRVARAGAREPLGRIAGTLDGHHVAVFVLPLGVRDHDRDRRAERPTVADPAQDLEGVVLEPLAATAAVPVATTRELDGDLLRRDGHGRRHPFEDGDQGLPVGLACGEHPEHGSIVALANQGSFGATPFGASIVAMTSFRWWEGAGAAPKRRPRVPATAPPVGGSPEPTSAG